MKKVEDDLHDALEDKYGGTPDEIADKARSMGMSVEKYIKYFNRMDDGCR